MMPGGVTVPGYQHCFDQLKGFHNFWIKHHYEKLDAGFFRGEIDNKKKQLESREKLFEALYRRKSSEPSGGLVGLEEQRSIAIIRAEKDMIEKMEAEYTKKDLAYKASRVAFYFNIWNLECHPTAFK